MDVHALLADDHLSKQQRACYHRCAQPQARGDVLGEGGHIHHPALRIEGLDRGQRLAGIAQVAVGVVLGDDHAVLGSQRRQGLSTLQRQRDAGGVLERGNHVHQLRVVLPDERLRRLHDHALVVGGHGDQLRVVFPHGLYRPEEGGTLAQHHVARIHQHLQQQVEGLATALHRKDLGSVAVHAVAPKEFGHALP